MDASIGFAPARGLTPEEDDDDDEDMDDVVVTIPGVPGAGETELHCLLIPYSDVPGVPGCC